jgi:hypothetical protein
MFHKPYLGYVSHVIIHVVFFNFNQGFMKFTLLIFFQYHVTAIWDKDQVKQRYVLPPFHSVSHPSISHIHIDANKSRHI